MKKEIRIILLLWLFMLLLGFLITNLFFNMYEKNKTLIKQSNETTAQIIKTNKNNLIYNYEIKYQVNNQKYQGIIKSFKNHENEIKIYYQIDNPAWIMEKTNRHLIIFITSLIFFLIPLINVITIIYQIIKNNQIKKKNNLITTKITKLEKRPNKWFPYLLECDHKYQTPITLEHYKYINYNQIKEIKVYRGKNNYYIDIDLIWKDDKKC